MDIEIFKKSIKGDAIRVTPPRSLDQAHRVVALFVDHCNGRRLHGAIG